MDGPGEPADPYGGVDPSAAFFGLWPKFDAERSDAAAREPRPRMIAHEPPRLRPA
ncbi:MAG TPA: hypothetical protein VF092_10815 [Longimicrobium sp.]